jgi:putative ATP-grasp target RiPP
MLTEPRHLFPLDGTGASTDAALTTGSASVPFGLKYAVAPAETVDVDLPSISYDPDRQIAVVSDGDATVPAMKHTSTNTKTTTASQDRKGTTRTRTPREPDP